MTEREYPVPAISLETEAYWVGANDGKLLMKRCTDCNKTHFYPRAICPIVRVLIRNGMRRQVRA